MEKILLFHGDTETERKVRNVANRLKMNMTSMSDPDPDSLLEGEVIDLNTASAADLTRLPGIGEKRAQAIVADREANGPFRIPEDLTRVSGIGEGILANIIDSITVE